MESPPERNRVPLPRVGPRSVGRLRLLSPLLWYEEHRLAPAGRWSSFMSGPLTPCQGAWLAAGTSTRGGTMASLDDELEFVKLLYSGAYGSGKTTDLAY